MPQFVVCQIVVFIAPNCVLDLLSFICGLPCPIKFLTRLTFLSFLCQLSNVRSLILTLYELSSVPSHYQHCPHGTAYYHQLTMTQNFLCFFLLDILFHFCFAVSSSSYINMCLNVHIQAKMGIYP